MEAIAIYDFNATADDELSFRKGNQLNILQTERDANWYNAELNGRVGFVPKNYIEMREAPWYFGKITRANAEMQLMRQPLNGAFLLRDSETNNEPGSFSLSVKFENEVQHFKILKDQNYDYYLWVQKFSSLNKLVEHHKTTSVSRVAKILLREMKPARIVVAQYDFQTEDEGELPFRKGDEIEVLDSSNQQWWKGQIAGMVGFFPAAYVAQPRGNGGAAANENHR